MHCTKWLQSILWQTQWRFVNQGCKTELINKHIKSIEKMDWKELLKERGNTTSEETKIWLVQVACKHWNIFSISKSFKDYFQNEPVKAFKHNKNLKELIGSSKVKKVKKHTSIIKKGKCCLCSVNHKTLCGKQVISSSTFKSQQANKSHTFSIYNIPTKSVALPKKAICGKIRNCLQYQAK